MTELVVQGAAIEVAGRCLLRDVNLRIAGGGIVALRGPSGLGKTTLLRALATLIPLAEGELRLDGLRPEDVGHPVWRRRCIYVAQRPLMLPGSLRENLERPFSYRSASGAYHAEQAEALLARVGLASVDVGQEARSLSVGEQQRVSLVRALLVEPELLLLDEPTSALDPDAIDLVEELLLECAVAGLGIAIVSHDVQQVERLGAESIELRRAS